MIKQDWMVILMNIFVFKLSLVHFKFSVCLAEPKLSWLDHLKQSMVVSGSHKRWDR